MWILNYVTNNSISEASADKGCIKGASDGKVKIHASSDYSQIPVAAPYGVSYLPVAGEETVVLCAGGENICLGTLSKSKGLEPGELMLESAGGASIELKNDGKVYINGRVAG